MIFLFYRTAADAVDNHKPRLREHEVDPRFTPHGGFILEHVEKDSNTFIDGKGFVRNRKVLRTEQRTDGAGRTHTMYICEAEVADAEFLKAIRDWQYHEIDAEMAERLRARPPIEPEPEPAPQEYIPPAEPESAAGEYRVLQREVRALMDGGAPRIRLNLPVAALREYVEAQSAKAEEQKETEPEAAPAETS